MEDKLKILVVDDEITICNILKLNLEIAGYEADIALSAEDVLRMDVSVYSLILLDVMMGNMNGFELGKILRKDPRTKNIPIIFCTAKDNETDVIEGFNAGADDYIRKPFSMKELILRTKSVLNRTYEKKESNKLIFKSLQLDMVRKQCILDNEEILLTKKEFDLLAFLLSDTEKIFSREEILDAVWEDNVCVIDRTIDVNINRLRKKIGIYGDNIITKLGFGYGFTEEIN